MIELTRPATLSVIILTFNEERHLARCIASLRGLGANVLVADSLSTDGTVDVARRLGARVIQQPWKNYSTQFNWALDSLQPTPDWVLRLDADEVLTDRLVTQIRHAVDTLDASIDGAYVVRQLRFQGRLIRHGGVFPQRALRLFRNGRGRRETRWMDEHILVAGDTVNLSGDLIDDNLNSLTWWTTKHNGYASREAVDILNLEYRFMPVDAIEHQAGGSGVKAKRWIKERVYARLPGGLRALAYFGYRYFLRLGILDGAAGLRFNLLQGLWYRYLVDAKIAEVRRYMQEHGVDARTAARDVLGIAL
jgi:glycosyltransferase involved in cell wall biosynthesis